MEGKKERKLSIFLLLISIIIIVIMGIFIFKLYKDRESAAMKVEELNKLTSTLDKTVEELQGKMDSISNTINNSTTDTSDKTTNSDNKSTENTNNKNNNNKNTRNENEVNKNSTNTNVTIAESKKILFEYSSGDSNAAKGNPEVLKVYKIDDNQLDFEYHAAWNSNDIIGTAKKTIDNTYVYQMDESKIEFLINAQGNNSVKVTEYKNGEVTSYVNLWK